MPANTLASAIEHGESDMLRVGYLVVGRKRGGFDPGWGEQIEAAAWRTMQQTSFHCVRAGAAIDELSLRVAVDELNKADCQTLVVVQPTMGDGRLVPSLVQRWSKPIVLWATTERQDGDRVSACTLVGMHAFGSLLAQLGHSFEMVNGHPDDVSTRRELDLALRLTTTRSRLRRAKIGLVGTHAPGFLNMRADPELFSSMLGGRICHLGLQEFMDAVRQVPEEQMKKERHVIDALGLASNDPIPEQALADTSRYAFAIRTMMSEQRLDALALRCWPELPNVIGTWPYLAFAQLADAGYTIAMEGDVDGAATLLLGRLMGFGVGYLSDWLEHDERTITLWHQGEAPLSLCEPGSAAMGRHFNNDKPVVVNARLAVDRDITLARLWHCHGRYLLTAAEARTVAPKRDLKGTCGRALLDGCDVPAWFDALCHAGMPHHLAIFSGHHAWKFKRLARQLGICWFDGMSSSDPPRVTTDGAG